MSMSRDRDGRPNRGTTNSHLAVPPPTAVIEDLLAAGFSIGDLRCEYQRLREHYEAGRRTPRTMSTAAVAAYAVARVPATAAVSTEALTRSAAVLRGWEPRTLLDVGSGLGSSAMAAVSVFPSLERLTLVEDAPGMIAGGQALAAECEHPAVRDAHWATGNATGPLESADLVVASYVLGEVEHPKAAVEEWWRASAAVLLIVEPGTPDGYDRILRARTQLVSAGGTIAAPCPHDAGCPLGEGRWCHFSVTVSRSRLHRAINAGTLSSEDEKFSYVAATRLPVGARPSRIIREPGRHGGHVRLEVCSDTAQVHGETVSRRDLAYPRIRKLRWGDTMPHPSESDTPMAAFAMLHLTAEDFRRLTLSGTRPGAVGNLPKAVIRPVEIQGQCQLQVITYDDGRATTVNVPDAASPVIAGLLRQPFRHVVATLADEVLEGRITKKGNLVTTRAATPAGPLDLRHDRPKPRPIPPDAPFLHAVGISVDGKVKPTRQSKYRQINDFILLLDQSPVLDQPGTVHVLDVGCGNAYLTYAAVHHLVHNRGMDCLVSGVDRNRELIQRNNQRAQTLGWHQLQFHFGDIETYEPDHRPDLVMALHACDTAADHALAAMVRWESDAGLVAPCCHHHVQSQLRRTVADTGDRLLVRDGILRERLGDVITDATRAAILRRVGYAVEVIQFVDHEHTPRNTLIRATKSHLPEPAGLRDAYETLIHRWSIQPLLGDLLASRLDTARPDVQPG